MGIAEPCGGLCRHTWERTHAITLNTTTPVPPWKIFIIIDIYLFIFYARHYLIIPNVTNGRMRVFCELAQAFFISAI